MPEVLACDTPIRPIKPADNKPVPADSPAGAPQARTSFFAEWCKLLAGRLGR